MKRQHRNVCLQKFGHGTGWLKIPVWVTGYARFGIELLVHRPVRSNAFSSDVFHLGKGWHVTDAVSGLLIIGTRSTYNTRKEALEAAIKRLDNTSLEDYNAALFRAMATAAPHDLMHTLVEDY